MSREMMLRSLTESFSLLIKVDVIHGRRVALERLLEIPALRVPNLDGGILGCRATGREQRVEFDRGDGHTMACQVVPVVGHFVRSPVRWDASVSGAYLVSKEQKEDWGGGALLRN